MIVCDHCEARTRQPLPHGWRVLWIGDLRAYGHACPSCGPRRDAGEVLPTITATTATFALKTIVVDEAVRVRAESIAASLEAAVRDELGLPADVLDDELRDLPQGDKSPSEPPPAAAIRPPSPKLIEPAPGVDSYDRPRLPRSLRDATPRDGATVEAFVRKVGETFVPPAATRPRAAAPDVKQPSSPPAPLQRSLFGGES